MTQTSPTELTWVQAQWPELAIDSFEWIGEGMDSKAWLCNQELIFRFPKHPSAAVALKREITLLPQLQPQLSLKIPQFCFVGQQPDNKPFVAYRALPGRELWLADWQAARPEQRQSWTGTLKQFLSEIHAFPLNQTAGIETVNFRQRYAQVLTALQTQAWALFSKSEQTLIQSAFKTYLKNTDHFVYTPVLLHADLSPEHVFFDPETQQIQGIIDFGDLYIGDPDYDLLYLYSEYGIEMIAAMGLATPERLSKLAFFMLSNPLEDILTGLERHDNQTVQEGLAWFQKIAKRLR